MIAPLGTGELDVGSGALSVGFWNALLRGVKFRIVADRGHAEPGYLYQTVFMRKDLVDGGQFKTPRRTSRACAWASPPRA